MAVIVANDRGQARPGRTLDDSLAHEYTHFIQHVYENAPIFGDATDALEEEAAMRSSLLAAALLALSVPSPAKDRLDSKPSGMVPKKGVVAAPLSEIEEMEPNLRIVVEAEYAGMRRSADFTAASSNQANFVTGGDKSFPVETKAGKGVEFKKWGFIVNVLPVVDPNNPSKIQLQLQLELSGPVPGQGTQDVETWQYQGTVTLTKGKPFKVSQGATRATVTVSDAPEG